METKQPWMPKRRFWTEDEQDRLLREHAEMLAACKQAKEAIDAIKAGKRDGGTMGALSLAWDDLVAAIDIASKRQPRGE